MVAGMASLIRAIVGTALAVLILAGCAPTTDPGETGIEDPEDDARGAGEPTEREAEVDVSELVAQAQAASQGGDHQRAAGLLERAVRVAPREAGIWQNLAVVRYRQGRYEEAQTLAQRSNRLAGEEQALRERNWALISAARRQLGDEAGAQEAEQRRDALPTRDTES